MSAMIDPPPAPSSLPALIQAAEAGDRGACEALFATLYRELHRVAANQLRRGASQTLGATTLLHECYLDMSARRADFPDQSRFIGYAARAMRGLIIDHVRQRKAIKRGGGFHLTALDTQVADETPEVDELVGLHDALVVLHDTDASLAELVDLKFFCGFSTADIAAMRRVSTRTVERDWQKVRLLLHEVLTSR